MEESPKARATKELVLEARRALRDAYVPEESGQVLSSVERALMLTCSKLCKAVEQRVDDSALPLTILQPEPESLEEIHARVTGYQNPPTETATDHDPRFVISFPEVELSLREIWPDGDAPENPTAEDVIEAMRGSDGVGHPMTVSSGWRLIDTLYIREHDDTDGEQEVEWDGT